MLGYVLCAVDTSCLGVYIEQLTGSTQYNQEKAVFGVRKLLLLSTKLIMKSTPNYSMSVRPIL